MNKLTLTAAVAASAFALAAPAAQASSPFVCNEAENSHRGGYTVAGGIVDPDPPARLRGSQMRVGSDAAAKGLNHAADRSPALRQCGVPTPPPPPPPVDPGSDTDPIVIGYD